MGTFRPDLIMKSLIPVIMSGIIAVYGLVVSVLIAQDLGPPSQGGRHYSLFEYVGTQNPERRKTGPGC